MSETEHSFLSILTGKNCTQLYAPNTFIEKRLDLSGKSAEEIEDWNNNSPSKLSCLERGFPS